MGRLTTGAAALVRATFGREELPPPPSSPARPAPREPGLLAYLFAAESLPPPPESLPPSAPRRARGGFSLLFGPDPLPSDLPPQPRRPGRWLSWLISPEQLDR